MNESEFNELAEKMLARLEGALEHCDADLDYSRIGDGILEIEFDDDSKIVVNRHAAAREIWVAARSGGYHFRWADGLWWDTRDGTELMAALSREISAHAQTSVELG